MAHNEQGAQLFACSEHCPFPCYLALSYELSLFFCTCSMRSILNSLRLKLRSCHSTALWLLIVSWVNRLLELKWVFEDIKSLLRWDSVHPKVNRTVSSRTWYSGFQFLSFVLTRLLSLGTFPFIASLGLSWVFRRGSLTYIFLKPSEQLNGCFIFTNIPLSVTEIVYLCISNFLSLSDSVKYSLSPW